MFLYFRQNCILADEMGLGKTIQSIALLSEVYAAGVQGPFLVIAPLSTITNWEREFSTWTNMNAIVYHGSLASRQMIQQYEMYCKDDKVELLVMIASNFFVCVCFFCNIFITCIMKIMILCAGAFNPGCVQVRCSHHNL